MCEINAGVWLPFVDVLLSSSTSTNVRGSHCYSEWKEFFVLFFSLNCCWSKKRKFSFSAIYFLFSNRLPGWLEAATWKRRELNQVRLIRTDLKPLIAEKKMFFGDQKLVVVAIWFGLICRRRRRLKRSRLSSCWKELERVRKCVDSKNSVLFGPSDWFRLAISLF